MFILDSHCDTPSQILRLRDLSKDNDHAHVDFPKLRRGGVDGAFFALYIPASLDHDSESAFTYAERLYKGILDTVAANEDKAAFAATEAEAQVNRSKGLFSVFLGLENGSPIGTTLERVKHFHDMGVRYITLCHTGNNEICDSCATKQKRWNGLSPFGREVVKEMNRLGMLVDVSHLSEGGFYDVAKANRKPFVASHSCARALCGHSRNLTDAQLHTLGDTGSICGINFYSMFLEQESEYSRNELILRHMEHVANKAGIEAVALGSDFDGITCELEMQDYSGMAKLSELVAARFGYDDAERILNKNALRVFREVIG
jgi:membrane dipeptidase